MNRRERPTPTSIDPRHRATRLTPNRERPPIAQHCCSSLQLCRDCMPQSEQLLVCKFVTSWTHGRLHEHQLALRINDDELPEVAAQGEHPTRPLNDPGVIAISRPRSA